MNENDMVDDQQDGAAAAVTDDVTTEQPRGPVAEASTPSERVLSDLKDNDPKRVEKFRAARAKERKGETPAVAVAPKPDAAAPPAQPDPNAAAASAQPRVITKRQQQINDYERQIAETAERTRALESEIAALKARPAPAASAQPAVAAPPAQPAAGSKSEWDQFMAFPDAPKQEQFDSFEAFFHAGHAFIQDKKQAVIEFRNRTERERSESHQYLVERAARAQQNSIKDMTDIGVNVDTLRANPATFGQAFTNELTRLGVSDDVRTLRTFSQLREGEAGTMHNAVAEEISECQHPIRVMQALSQPGELARVAGLKTVRAMIRAIERIDASFDAPVERASFKTKAPDGIQSMTSGNGNQPPPSTDELSQSHNVRAYRQARLRQRLGKE